jgi:hypothetical protein
LTMRGATAETSRRGEVTVPRASEVGELPGAPPASELPPGALLGAVRAPKPFVPSADPVRDRLGMTADGDGGYREDRARFSARVDRDGHIEFRDRGNIQPDGLGLSFDLTDAVLHALGDDPYAYEKMRIMERTRDVRAGMALRDRGDRMREAVVRLPAYLARIWGHDAWTPAQKRRALFALWDEVAEEGDPEMLRGGEAVRAIILAFIARHLPEGGAHAFTADELAAMNRERKSKQRFEPYHR